jgi:putative ABC transport system permease protein
VRATDHIEQAWSNLWKKRLRTFLTTSGVVIGIGALICMFAFAQGIQANVRREFNEMGLFNYITISAGADSFRRTRNHPGEARDSGSDAAPVSVRKRLTLDKELVSEISKIPGVEAVFPEMRFPAQIRIGEREQFTLVQVFTAEACQSGLVRLREGQAFKTDDPNELVISDVFLRRLGITEPANAIGKQLEVRTLSLDFSLTNLLKMVLNSKGPGLPVSNTNYAFTIVGVAEQMGMRGGMIPTTSDVLIPPGPAEHMQKLELTSIWDFFQPGDKSGTFSTLSVKVDSPSHVTAVEEQLQKRGLRTFALVHQLNQAERMFVIMDMFVLAVGMIGITVASLGVLNTMFMAILERYREIGIMKAVGATDGDVQKIFLFESGMIGLLGGVGGLLLARLVSLLINAVINAFSSREGMPHMQYFDFTWWVCLGGILFSIVISLLAGLYPTRRAARVDPVVALRHD